MFIKSFNYKEYNHQKKKKFVLVDAISDGLKQSMERHIMTW